jgi:hypothetical protein
MQEVIGSIPFTSTIHPIVVEKKALIATRFLGFDPIV